VLLSKVRAHPESDLPEASSDCSAEPRGAGADRLVRIGAAVFAVGLLAVAAAVLPLFFGVHDLPTALNVAAGVLPPLGFGLALWGLVRAAQGER
jgi:hypothetical protein